MNKQWVFWLTVVCIVSCVFLCPDPAFAGPGGQIASALFRTLPGKILLTILVIIFLPMIIYVSIKEYIAVRRTRRDLLLLAKTDPRFDWMSLKERITESFQRVHAAWRKEDMEQASEWMTDWYWQNQQLVFLNQWEQDGLVNHCRVKSISSVRPLFVRYKNDNGSIDGSRLVVSITANLEDYLAERVSGKVVQGAKGYTDEEKIWSFVFERGRWVVANIESSAMSLEYAKLTNEVPQSIAAPGSLRAG